MSESSESVISDTISPDSSPVDVNGSETNCSSLTISQTKNIRIDVNEKPSYSSSQNDVSFTDSDHSFLEIPKLLNASSPSSVCSIRPLEWDSGADVGYDITSKQQNQDLSTIERIAVNSLVFNANSTPIDYEKRFDLKTKSNSLTNLKEIELSKEKKSASYEAFKFTTIKSDTLPKFRSPMTSSLSVSTVVHKLESLNTKNTKQLIDENVNLIFEKQFENLNINSNKETKSYESIKESNSNSTLGSVDTAGSWMASEFCDSINITTDRVNSFEYLSGNAYYNGRNNELEDNLLSDKEIKQSTKMLVEAMKQSGLTNEIQRKKIFQEIIEKFLNNFVQDNNNSKINSNQTPLLKQDFTSQTSNTTNTIVNKPPNQSSTITFNSPITSSQYGDDVISMFDESSLDSGRHIDLQKCKPKEICIPIRNKRKNQSVQCSIQNNFTKYTDGNKVQSTFNKSNSIKKNRDNLKLHSNSEIQSKKKCSNVNNELKKQLIWLHRNYMKAERENQLLWINNQKLQLNNLKKLLNIHEELNKNWDLYKQNKTTVDKIKFRRHLLPTSSSSNITSTTKTSSTISSKQFSSSSRCDDTEAESSTTVCDHVHYKKGIAVNDHNCIIKCCEKKLQLIKEEKQKQNSDNFKTACAQTEIVNETDFKCYRNRSSHNSIAYAIDHPIESISNKSSISYDIIFKPTSKCFKETNFVNKNKKQKGSISVACQTNDIPFKPTSSLQEYLMTNRPDYVCRAEERQNILSCLADLRNKRKSSKRDFLMSNSYEKNIPPFPLAVKRVMSQKEMRKQTELNYSKCPEVKNKKIEIKRKEEYKTNKIMANIFNKNLQKKTLKGKVDLSNSVSVISL